MEGDVRDVELGSRGYRIESTDGDEARVIWEARAVGHARVVEEGRRREDSRGEAAVLLVPDTEAVALFAEEHAVDLLLGELIDVWLWEYLLYETGHFLD